MSQKADKKFFTLVTFVMVLIAVMMIAFYFLGGKLGSVPIAPLNIGQSSDIIVTTIRELFS